MLHAVANFFANFPHELAVLLVAMTPILEQRIAIPLGVLIYHMSPLKAFAITMLGNIPPVLLVLFFAQHFHDWVQRKSGTFFGKAWAKKLKQAQDAFSKYEKYGLLGLALFIALPIPGSGVFTGAFLAFLMGVPFKHSWPYIIAGVVGSGLVTISVVIGAVKIF